MNRTIRLLVIGLAAGAIVLTGCASSTTDTTTTDKPATTPATTATTVAAAATESCVACHTDEEALRILAVEPPDVEVLSEGEG